MPQLISVYMRTSLDFARGYWAIVVRVEGRRRGVHNLEALRWILGAVQSVWIHLNGDSSVCHFVLCECEAQIEGASCCSIRRNDTGIPV